jgi:hypothetical protein
MKTKIEIIINCIKEDEAKTVSPIKQIERTVYVDGNERYRDISSPDVYKNFTDPLAMIEKELFHKSQCDDYRTAIRCKNNNTTNGKSH